MTNAITTNSYIWTDSGTKPTKGDETYERGKQPVAAYDNWSMWAVTKDIDALNQTLGDHAEFHEAGGQAELDLDGLGVGRNPADTITESSTPQSFTFTASSQRDIHTKTDVLVSNGTSSSATEDVTVELYRGSDASGTLVIEETKSVTVASGGSKTPTFLDTDKQLDDDSYYVEITQSGSALSIDQTDEYTLGGRYVTKESSTGDLQFEDHYGDVYAERHAVDGHWTTFPAFGTNVDLKYNSLDRVADVNADDVRARHDDFHVRTSGSGSGQVKLYDESAGQDIARAHEGGELEVPNGALSVGDDLQTTGGATIWDASAGHVPQGRLENDAIDVSYDGNLSGEASVALGGTLNLSVDDDFVKNSGDTMAGNLDMGGNDLEDGGTTVWDTSAGHVPQGRLENDSLTVSAGDGLKGGGQTALGGSTTLNVEPANFAGAGLTDDGSDNLALSNDSVTISAGNGLSGGGSVALGGSVNLSVEAAHVEKSGDSMSGDLDMGSNATQYGDFEVRANSSTNALEFNYTG
ncbi:hypothetical protein [Halorussus halophilus]|uniref:hypothetical protein n=1 Tax=Halorussus halophilus TaxID=2650975 RepID=UPI00130165A4|nr:hypothetical protein [Halorussus halophilus]